LQLRRALSIPREYPINVYDVAESIGVGIQFVDLPSLEGMFYRGPDPKIILPSLRHRPRGRVTFTCAHELGHFELGHGTRVDEYIEDTPQAQAKTDEEVAADTFSSSLLMPRPAVLDRFACREWELETATPLQILAVAGELDVGYTTLIKHLCYGLQLVDRGWLTERERVTPKALQASIAGKLDSKRVVLVDEHWPQVPIDLEVGECIALPAALDAPGGEWAEDKGLNGNWRLIGVRRPGMFEVGVDGITRVVRLARQGYCGLFKYRYLEDVDGE
jgi:hypothetical protein